MRSLIVAVFIVLLGLGQSARADVVLLVHGYLGNAGSWEFSGVNAVLAHNGWQPAGIIGPGPGGPLLPPPYAKAANKAYTIELPSTAPLMVQSDILIAALQALRSRHSGEKITLVGHSAGGVVARLALVRGGAAGVTRLIVIAAPNLGTERAWQALDATHEGGPVGFVKDVFGGGAYHAVKDSWPVLLDLSPAVPGSLLFWLNGQPHPRIEYVSIVRGAPFGLGDLLVPGFSQDLNNVPALRGQARTVVVPAGHELVAADGTMLASLLNAGR
jgi:pimeloyl-ACP methyl ester carboxylesterase